MKNDKVIYDSIELQYLPLNTIELKDGRLVSDVAIYVISIKNKKVMERGLEGIIRCELSYLKKDAETRGYMGLPAEYSAKELSLYKTDEDMIIPTKSLKPLPEKIFNVLKPKYYLGRYDGQLLILTISDGKKQLSLLPKDKFETSSILTTYDSSVSNTVDENSANRSMLYTSGIAKGGIKLTTLKKSEGNDTRSVLTHDLILKQLGTLTLKDKHVDFSTFKNKDLPTQLITYNFGETKNILTAGDFVFNQSGRSLMETIELPKNITTLGNSTKSSSITISLRDKDATLQGFAVDFRNVTDIRSNSLHIRTDLNKLILTAQAISNNYIFSPKTNGMINELHIVIDSDIDAQITTKKLIKYFITKDLSFIRNIVFVDANDKPLDVNLADTITETIRTYINLLSSTFIDKAYEETLIPDAERSRKVIDIKNQCQDSILRRLVALKNVLLLFRFNPQLRLNIEREIQTTIDIVSELG